jgi:hypothetical protein
VVSLDDFGQQVAFRSEITPVVQGLIKNPIFGKQGIVPGPTYLNKPNIQAATAVISFGMAAVVFCVL